MAEQNPIFTGLPPEYQAQIDEAERRRRIAQMMAQQAFSFKGAPQQGALASKTSPLAWLAHGLAGGLSLQNDAAASGEAGKIRTQFGQDQAAELERLQGLPEDQRISEGQRSKFPLAQSIAKVLQEARQKRFDTAHAELMRENPNIGIEMARTGQLPTQPVPQKLVTVGDRRVPQDQSGYFGPQFEPPKVTIPGNGLPPVLTQQNKDSGKVDDIVKAPQIRLSVSQTGDDAFAKALGGKLADRIDAARGVAEAAYKTVDSIRQMRELDSKGVLSTPGANWIISAGVILKNLGMPVDSAKLANSEAYQREFAQQIGNYLTNSSLGRTLTDTDRKFLEQALPTLGQTPEGRAQIYDRLERSAAQTIKSHQNFQSQLEKKYPQLPMFVLNPVDNYGGTGGVSPMETQPVQGTPTAKPSKKNPYEGFEIIERKPR